MAYVQSHPDLGRYPFSIGHGKWVLPANAPQKAKVRFYYRGISKTLIQRPIQKLNLQAWFWLTELESSQEPWSRLGKQTIYVTFMRNLCINKVSNHKNNIKNGFWSLISFTFYCNFLHVIKQPFQNIGSTKLLQT